MSYYEKKIIISLNVIVIFFCIFFCVPSSNADENGIVGEIRELSNEVVKYKDELAGEYKLIIGYGRNRINLKVEYKDGEKEGTLSEDSDSPFISVYSPVKYFHDSSAGYFFKADFSFFDLDTQKKNTYSELEKLGTNSNGYGAFIMPILFYEYFGGIRSGIGLGLGYLRAKGNIYLYDRNNNIELHEFNISRFGMSIGVVVFEKSFGNFVVKVDSYGPYIHKEDYEYSLQFLSFRLGYIF